MIPRDVKSPTAPIPFHKLLRVVAIVDSKNQEIQQLLDHITAENFQVEVSESFDRDVSEDADVGGYIALVDGDRLEKALDTLQQDGVIASWQYDRWDEAIAQQRGWGQVWTQATLLLDPPQVIRETYKSLQSHRNRDRDKDDEILALKEPRPLQQPRPVSQEADSALAVDESLAQRIKLHRKKMGLSQTEDADQVQYVGLVADEREAVLLVIGGRHGGTRCYQQCSRCNCFRFHDHLLDERITQLKRCARRGTEHKNICGYIAYPSRLVHLHHTARAPKGVTGNRRRAELIVEVVAPSRATLGDRSG